MSLPFWLGVPALRDTAKAEYDTWGFEVAGFSFGKPFSTAPAYTTQNGAIDEYLAHMEALRDNQNWPDLVVEPFKALAEDAPGSMGYSGAAAVYVFLIRAEMMFLDSHGIDPTKLSNWTKHRIWLESAAEASGAAAEALEAAGALSVIKEGIEKSKEEVLYPLGIPLWGWVGVGAFAFLAIRK